jgi:hypothetical protein
VGEIVEEAVRRYLEASSITDLDAGGIAETQVRLICELQDMPGETEDDRGGL